MSAGLRFALGGERAVVTVQGGGAFAAGQGAAGFAFAAAQARSQGCVDEQLAGVGVKEALRRCDLGGVVEREVPVAGRPGLEPAGQSLDRFWAVGS